MRQPTAAAAPAVQIRVDAKGKGISPHLFGVFFEDLNYAADGGLYAELVQNRSFEYAPSDRREWHALTGWETVERGNAKGSVVVERLGLVHPNNPQYVRLKVDEPGDGFGLSNAGYDGLTLRAGESHAFSAFVRVDGSNPGPLRARLETQDGRPLAEATLDVPTGGWQKVSARLTPSEAASNARLVVLATGKGTLALDVISLFPRTFKDRPNGLRPDLAQAIADLKPGFVRFPGGCLVHGDGLNNLYRWKETIGPVEQRRGQRNIWNYHQSVGLGYFEYFQFCEDVGAIPLPVVAAGVSCQNTGAAVTGRWGQGQEAIPLEQMPAYIQDVLDLVEWANGPADSTWGAKRAAAGHPEPFGLKYLGVGNEDHITPAFEQRFRIIHDALRAKHPEIVIVGTSGPAAQGADFDEGWRIARETRLAMIDEHYYLPPDWFWSNLARYDGYDRAGTKVYLGEYAAHERNRANTLRSALAEAAFMTALERNGDVVEMASYAPLLCKDNHRHWQPDLLYFTNDALARTANYHVQQLFGANAGSELLPLTMTSADDDDAKAPTLAASCVRDGKSGDVIVKLVSRRDEPARVALDLSAVLSADKPATRTVLAGDALAVNTFKDSAVVAPSSEVVTIAPMSQQTLPPHSLTVIRIAAR